MTMRDELLELASDTHMHGYQVCERLQDILAAHPEPRSLADAARSALAVLDAVPPVAAAAEQKITEALRLVSDGYPSMDPFKNLVPTVRWLLDREKRARDARVCELEAAPVASLMQALADRIERAEADADKREAELERERDSLAKERDAAIARAESAELGCEIAYRREPTQAEGDAHACPLVGDIPECHVPMGDHHGHRCACSRWLWDGSAVCPWCADALLSLVDFVEVDESLAYKIASAVNGHDVVEGGPMEREMLAALLAVLPASFVVGTPGSAAEAYNADAIRLRAERDEWRARAEAAEDRVRELDVPGEPV